MGREPETLAPTPMLDGPVQGPNLSRETVRTNSSSQATELTSSEAVPRYPTRIRSRPDRYADTYIP